MDTHPVTELQRRYLAAMGIDVWVHRGRLADLTQVMPDSPAAAAPATSANQPPPAVHEKAVDEQATQKKAQGSPPEAAPTAIEAQDLQPAPEASGQDVEVPSFSLALLHYGSLGLCLSMAEGEEVPKVFCDDLARAAGANVKAVKHQQLDWPMVNSNSMDQSIAVARQVVASKLVQLPSRILMLGQDLARWHEPLTGANPGDLVQAGDSLCLLLPSASEIMASADEKRRLWSLLKNMLENHPAKSLSRPQEAE